MGNLLLALEQGHWMEAEEGARAILSTKPNCVEALRILASSLKARGELKDALDQYRRLESTGEMSAEDHTACADALLACHEIREALRHSEKAVRIDPQNAFARLQRAVLLQHSGEHEEAMDELRELMKLDPLSPAPFWPFTQGKKFKEEDRPILEQMKQVAKTAQMQPDDRILLNLAMASAHNDLGEFEEAMARYDKANSLAKRTRPQPFDPGRYESTVGQIIDTFQSSFFERYRSLGLDSDLPIFVVGMPRSGTTLTEQIISSHPDVFGGGEIPFWVNEGPNVIDVSSRALDPLRGARLAGQYLEILRSKNPDAKRVTDKMPFNYFVVGLLHILYPNARIVHCRRHPVDTCISMYATPFKESPPFANDKDNMVFAYRQYARLMSHWRRVIPADRLFEIRYEELVDHFEEQSRRLIEFCGLEWNEACLRPERNSREIATASQWQARQRVYGTSVERWRSYEPYLGAFRSLIESPPAE